MEEEYEGQRHTAYHEAGHAIAAIKTPHGAVEHIDICNREENDAENGGTNASSPDADDAFRVYGGPWAHVKFYRPSESISLDSVLTCMRDNADDWVQFQEYATRDAGKSSAESIQAWHERADRVMASDPDLVRKYRQPRHDTKTPGQPTATTPEPETGAKSGLGCYCRSAVRMRVARVNE